MDRARWPRKRGLYTLTLGNDGQKLLSRFLKACKSRKMYHINDVEIWVKHKICTFWRFTQTSTTWIWCIFCELQSFKNLESNFFPSLRSFKVYQPRFLNHQARSTFWKSAWKIHSNFHIYESLHFVTQHIKRIATHCCWMMLILFTQRNRWFLIPLSPVYDQNWLT